MSAEAQIGENKNRIDDHEVRISRLEPKVRNHELILYGDPTDRKDEGIIGVLNNLDKLVENIKSWTKPVGLSLIGAAVMFIVKIVADIYLALQTMP